MRLPVNINTDDFSVKKRAVTSVRKNPTFVTAPFLGLIEN